MDNDRMLLEKAAKAADYGFTYKRKISNEEHEWISSDGMLWRWNPLIDDGQALRLVVKLKLDIEIYSTSTHVYDDTSEKSFEEEHNGDPYAATRRAIVRAAASIGETMV